VHLHRGGVVPGSGVHLTSARAGWRVLRTRLRRTPVDRLVAAGCRLGWGPRFSTSVEPHEIGELLALDAPVQWPEPALV
jgi:hypothetical protein